LPWIGSISRRERQERRAETEKIGRKYRTDKQDQLNQKNKGKDKVKVKLSWRKSKVERVTRGGRTQQ
jgi:hypothetical protein